MNEKIKFWFAVLIALFAAGCSGNRNPVIAGAPAYLPISAVACKDSVGLDGKWQLVGVHSDGRNVPPVSKDILIVKDCSVLEYYSADKLIKTESFKLYRVLNYCADYQLDYIARNDSISCINIRRDTLIFGDCSTFESPRFFYKRM